MWRRTRDRSEEPPKSYEVLITELQERAEQGDPEVVNELANLLLVRGLVATRDDRDSDALDDYRAAADLLRADGAVPTSVDTQRTVWMSLAVGARRAGQLTEALDAARRAVAVSADLPADVPEACSGFYLDLKNLTVDLKRAGEPGLYVESAGLALDWSRALSAADGQRFGSAVGITGAEYAKALGSTGRLEEAVAVAGHTLIVLRERGLGAIKLGLLMGLGTWLRALGRWEEAVDVEREAVAEERANPGRRALVEVFALRMLAQSLAGAGRVEEARATLEEALDLIRAPGPGVVALDPDQTIRNAAAVRQDLEGLDGRDRERAWTGAS